MPALNFSAPNIAIVAYAEIDGATGASTRLNSGVVTSRVSQGEYTVFLPTSMGQFEARDMIMVQTKNDPGGGGIVGKNISAYDADAAPTGLFKAFTAWEGSLHGGATPPFEATKVDTTFVFLILRTTISPPGASPA